MFIADLHIHSQYSMATSRDCIPEILDLWARRKGLGLIGTGDFTHPAWREELKRKLVPAEEGLYRLQPEYLLPVEGEIKAQPQPRLVVSGEISSIYKKDGKVRKIHSLILLPGLSQAEKLSQRLEQIGNIRSDGRPILGLDSRQLLEITLEICPSAIFIPAHIWTPHFSLLGYSGFEAVEECFEDLTPYIYALETGLSSDPGMNRLVSALDTYLLVSNSDAHSPANLAREANIFTTECSYPAIWQALQRRDRQALSGTIEFFPQEGKYHYDGHRACRVCFSPAETAAVEAVCPVCGRKLTLGVLNRVEYLSDRRVAPTDRLDYCEHLLPLVELVAGALQMGKGSKRVQQRYLQLLCELGSELKILREVPLAEIERQAGITIANGVQRMRSGELKLSSGYDGEYGKVIWGE